MRNKIGGKRYKPAGTNSTVGVPHAHLMTAAETKPSSHEANPAPGASTNIIKKTGFWYTAKSGKNKGQRVWRELGDSYGKRRKKIKKVT
jgi:hypothetical protein